MDDLSSAYFSGVWHGGLGVSCVIFGILGWPSTRFILGVLFWPLRRKPPRVPVGSAYFDKYYPKSSRSPR